MIDLGPTTHGHEKSSRAQSACACCANWIWLLKKLTPRGVVFCFLSFSLLCSTCCVRQRQQPYSAVQPGPSAEQWSGQPAAALPLPGHAAESESRPCCCATHLQCTQASNCYRQHHQHQFCSQQGCDQAFCGLLLLLLLQRMNCPGSSVDIFLHMW